MTEPTHLGTYDDTMRLYVRHLDRNLRAVSPSFPIRELSIVSLSSASKPDDFVAMLRAMADQIEQLAEAEREGRTPFLIDAITADPADGILTVYYRNND
jgi:hypothetical protein